MSSDIPNLAELVQRAEQFVRTAEEQQRAESAAEARGWAECGKTCADLYAEAWEAGYWAHEADRQADWEVLSAQIRARAAGRTFEEKCAAELASCGPRPGDFLGVERDPTYIDRCRASLEATVHNHHQRAA